MARPRKSETEQRRTRVPFGSHRLNLDLPEIKGYVTRWFNDRDGRIQRAEAGGWEFVTDVEAGAIGQSELHEDNSDLNGRVSKIVSRGKDNVTRAFAMKIKEAWYKEDQAAKEGKLASVDEALMAGNVPGSKVENNYVPTHHKNRILG